MPDYLTILEKTVSLKHLEQFPPKSLLLLLKNTEQGGKYTIRYYLLENGKREEYLNYMLQHPDFDKYFIYNANDSETLKIFDYLDSFGQGGILPIL